MKKIAVFRTVSLLMGVLLIVLLLVGCNATQVSVNVNAPTTEQTGETERTPVVDNVPQTSAAPQNDYEQQTPDVAPSSIYSAGPKSEGYINYSTPGHAGVNVRSQASSDSVLLTTLPEGTSVFYFKNSRANGYVYCELSGQIGGIINGWILEEYIIETVSIENYAIVSYNTPGHAGVNVRSQASSDSALLTTLPEGTPLYYFPDRRENGYIYCDLSGQIGGIINGWILEEYIDF